MRRFLAWLITKLLRGVTGDRVAIVPAYAVLLKPEALVLVRKYDKLDLSGEAKRSYVYGKLVKKYYDTPRWVIGLAIELAVMSDGRRW